VSGFDSLGSCGLIVDSVILESVTLGTENLFNVEEKVRNAIPRSTQGLLQILGSVMVSFNFILDTIPATFRYSCQLFSTLLHSHLSSVIKALINLFLPLFVVEKLEPSLTSSQE